MLTTSRKITIKPLTAIVLVALATGLWGQQGTTASGQNSGDRLSARQQESTVEGTVVKDQGSEPLKKTIVNLITEDRENGESYTATSDTEGRFRIEKV